ncbi:MAG: ChaN family lipoprotein [Candidatus Latescibacterota bacterium]|nr:MAG: ChaN family lipoprotein [Candidatus Latescibacterota bacterium]
MKIIGCGMTTRQKQRVPVLVSLVIGLSFLAGSGCAQKLDLPELTPEFVQAATAYLDSHRLSPEEYVVSKFADHDVIILGEAHYHKHDPMFVQRLIPLVHKNGVHTLAMEFARREDQRLIDSLLAGASYDKRLANEIQFRQYVHFGFQEYVDIYKAAWTLNQGLKPDERPFRIAGLNNSPDWSHVRKKEDREDGNIMKKVWKGQTEEDWAKVILDLVGKGEKVLVYSGLHHAFSEYKQPVVNPETGEVWRFEEGRMGNHVFRALGKRVITIALHAPWFSDKVMPHEVYAADGHIDALMHELGSDYYPIGFDTHGTPFANLPGESSLYAQGYDSFVLKNLCDGYIYFKPIPEYEGVTPIYGFVNENNVERARLRSPNPKRRDASVEQFYVSAMTIANIQWKYRKFK